MNNFGDSGLRIALSGSSGTGKTTLSKRLAESLGIPWSSDGVREAIADLGFTSHKGMDKATIRRLCERVAERRIAFESVEHTFVADTSTVDSTMFWRRAMVGALDDGIVESFVARCRTHAARYTHVIVLPFGGIPLVSDGVRTDNAEYQLDGQNRIDAILSDWKLTPLRMPIDVITLEARVEWVRSALKMQSGNG